MTTRNYNYKYKYMHLLVGFLLLVTHSCAEENERERRLPSVNPRIFPIQSYVAVEFNGREEVLNNCEKELLEEGFVKVYAKVQAESCDPFRRTVESANLNVKPGCSQDGNYNHYNYRGYRDRGHRQLQQGSSVPDGSAFYNVAGTCRDCPVSESGGFPIFDDSFRRRRLALQDRYAFQGQCSPPTIGAFLQEYNRYIRRLVQRGQLRSVTRVTSLQEYETGPNGHTF